MQPHVQPPLGVAMGHQLPADRKRFEDMCREELLETKSDLERQLREVKLKLSKAKQVAAATGHYLEIAEFSDLETRRGRLNWLMSKVDAQLRKRKGSMRTPDSPPLLAEKFMAVAQTVLEPGLYNHLVEEARSRP